MFTSPDTEEMVRNPAFPLISQTEYPVSLKSRSIPANSNPIIFAQRSDNYAISGVTSTSFAFPPNEKLDLKE